jgi:tetratricopeptide (TPR) repeat protein
LRVWEGGNLDVADQWVDAHVLRGRQYLAAGDSRKALADFKAAAVIPDNLPSERITSGARDAELNYWHGIASQAAGLSEQARELWRKAAASGDPGSGRRPGRRGLGGLSPALAQRYYQALSLQKLGQTDQAKPVLQDLIAQATRAAGEASKPDPESSFEVQLAARDRMSTAHYIAGLGYLGLNESAKAKEAFATALQWSPDHLGARTAAGSLK